MRLSEGLEAVQKQIKFIDYESRTHPRLLLGPKASAAASSAPRCASFHDKVPLHKQMNPINRVVLGDGLRFMGTLPDATLDAIYFDPPFFTGESQQGDRGQFEDRWASMESYLDWLKPWATEAFRLLKPTGWLWLHLDWHTIHYAKVLLDNVFGIRNFRNEIIWHYTGRRTPAVRRFNQKHDSLLLYGRSPSAKLAPLFEPWTRDEYVTLKRQAVHVDDEGREWIWGHAGRGRSRAYRIYLDDQVDRGRAVDSVWDLPIINTSAKERTGYPTQKPEALLRRIVASSVPPHGLIGDFMAGSGTTACAAWDLGRRFLIADSSPDAVAIAAERLEIRGALTVVETIEP
jgi:DNA modification methylase